MLENRIRKNERGKGMSKKEVRENPGNLNYVIFGYIRFGFERSTSLLRMPYPLFLNRKSYTFFLLDMCIIENCICGSINFIPNLPEI